MKPVCNLRRRQLAQYAALGEGPPAGSRLQRHVVRCPVCRAAWQELSALAADLPQALAAPAASASFAEGVWARIAAGAATEPAQAPPLQIHAKRLVPVGAALASALLLVVFGGRLLLERQGDTEGNQDRMIAFRPPDPGRRAAPPESSPAVNDGFVPGEAPSTGLGTRSRSRVPGRLRPGYRPGYPRSARVGPVVDGGPSGQAWPDGPRTEGPHSGNGAGGQVERGDGASDDLAFLNADPMTGLRPWVWLPGQEWSAVEALLRRQVRVRDDFVTIPFPRLAAASERQIAAAVESYKKEAAVVDARLFREVTVAVKATALSNMCEQFRAEHGIQLVAGRSVADEKVTVFCQKQPLRDLMRQLSRPFGYTWLRSGKPGEYRYELAQDLKSQLLEEELRNRDRNEALLALDQEMSQYRRYFGMTPDEALAKAKTAPPEERQRLERYAGTGWGAAQMYFRLSPQEIEHLRAGRRLTYSVGPAEGEQPLPPEMAGGALESMREMRARQDGDLYLPADAPGESGGVPLTSLPGIRPKVTLQMSISDLGQFTLVAGVGFNISPTPGDGRHRLKEHELAVGISPAVRNPRNAVANARLARDAALQPRVTVTLPGKEVQTVVVRGNDVSTPTVRKVTSADVLEAIHRISGVPIVADYYTRLYPIDAVGVKDQSLFDTLNQACDAMRMRWNKDGKWVQLRSTSFFHDRLKEVPNRLLSRWAASRKENGALTLEDLMEIAGLPDAQLDAESMAEGARDLHGLAEWDIARRRSLRPHLRFLAQLGPAQRQEALSRTGLPFAKLSLPQQQQFMMVAFGPSVERLRSMEELARATMRVEYSLPGGFEWRTSARPGAPSRQPLSFEPARVRAASREAAFQAARKLDPDVPEEQILPTELAVMVEYSLGPDSPFQPAGIRAGLWGTINSTVLMPREGR